MKIPITIYLAGPWVCKPQVREAREKLRAAGFHVSSYWIDHHGDNSSDLTQEALTDMAQVQECDVFVLLNLEKSEGKAAELGAAYTMRKPCYVVGAPEDRKRNIFYHLPLVKYLPTVEAVIDALHPQDCACACTADPTDCR